MSGEKSFFRGCPGGIADVQRDSVYRNTVVLRFEEQIEGKLTFLEENIFRYDVDPEGVFESYAVPRDKSHVARIQQYPDESAAYTKPEPELVVNESHVTVRCGSVKVLFERKTGRMKISIKTGV